MATLTVSPLVATMCPLFDPCPLSLVAAMCPYVPVSLSVCVPSPSTHVEHQVFKSSVAVSPPHNTTLTPMSSAVPQRTIGEFFGKRAAAAAASPAAAAAGKRTRTAPAAPPTALKNGGKSDNSNPATPTAAAAVAAPAAADSPGLTPEQQLLIEQKRAEALARREKAWLRLEYATIGESWLRALEGEFSKPYFKQVRIVRPATSGVRM
jgi:hypothetical protein